MIGLILLSLVALSQGSGGDNDHSIKVNMVQECEDDINELIHMNLAATFQYIAKAAHYRQFDSESVGMAIMFGVHAREKLNDSKHLMKYLIHRGAHVAWAEVPKPEHTEWEIPTAALVQALAIEKKILNQIIKTHTCAQTNHDPDLMHDMADNMIVGEENTIFELGSYVHHLSHEGVDAMAVLPHLSAKMFFKYKDYKDCMTAGEEITGGHHKNGGHGGHDGHHDDH